MLHWSAETDAAIEQRVADILADVRQRGDAAVLEYTRRFDGLTRRVDGRARTHARRTAAPRSTPITPAQRERAAKPPPRACAATTSASSRPAAASWSYRDDDGTLLGQKVTPLDRVGIYVPGGKAAYPSSVLMNAIPAQVAGVGEIIMVVPTPRGEKNALVLAAAARGRRRPRVHDRRRAGGGRAGLRHGDDARGRQDHRPRQRLRRQRQAARVRHRSAST